MSNTHRGSIDDCPSAGLSVVSSLIQIINNLGELFAKSNGITLGAEQHTVESISKDEDWQLCLVLQLHLLCNLTSDATIAVDAVDDVLWQFAIVLMTIFLGLGLVLLVEFSAHLGNVTHGMVSGLLANTQHTHDKVSASRLRQNANGISINRF